MSASSGPIAPPAPTYRSRRGDRQVEEAEQVGRAAPPAEPDEMEGDPQVDLVERRGLFAHLAEDHRDRAVGDGIAVGVGTEGALDQ